MKNKQLKLFSSKIISVVLAASVLINNVSAMKPASQPSVKDPIPKQEESDCSGKMQKLIPQLLLNECELEDYSEESIAKLMIKLHLNGLENLNASDKLIIELLLDFCLDESYEDDSADTLFAEAMKDYKKACIALLMIRFLSHEEMPDRDLVGDSLIGDKTPYSDFVLNAFTGEETWTDVAENVDGDFFCRLTRLHSSSESDFKRVFVYNADNLQKLIGKVNDARKDVSFNVVKEHKKLLKYIDDFGSIRPVSGQKK